MFFSRLSQGEKSCPYYMQTGMCKFGVACKFHHPHPQPHNGQSTTHGMSSFPYTMMTLPRATYGVMPPPQVPHPQAYMPFMFAPPQGWSPYMVSLVAQVEALLSLSEDTINR